MEDGWLGLRQLGSKRRGWIHKGVPSSPRELEQHPLHFVEVRIAGVQDSVGNIELERGQGVVWNGELVSAQHLEHLVAMLSRRIEDGGLQIFDQEVVGDAGQLGAEGEKRLVASLGLDIKISSGFFGLVFGESRRN